MSPPRFVFNHICMFDLVTQKWYVYHRLQKKLNKTVECYGNSYLGVGDTADDAIADAVKENGVKRYDVQVLGGLNE